MLRRNSQTNPILSQLSSRLNDLRLVNGLEKSCLLYKEAVVLLANEGRLTGSIAMIHSSQVAVTIVELNSCTVQKRYGFEVMVLRSWLHCKKRYEHVMACYMSVKEW
jgi:hypothetical protein